MSKESLLNKTEAAEFVGMSKQLFDYYDSKDRVPGLEIKGGYRLYDKQKLKGWKPKDKRFNVNKRRDTK